MAGRVGIRTHLEWRRLAALAVVVMLAGCAGAMNFSGLQRPRSYTAHRGDTLYSIAWHYGFDYHNVARWNGIAYPYTIHPGERIYLYPHRASAHRGVAHKPRTRRQKKPTTVAKTMPLQKQPSRPRSSVQPVDQAGNPHWQWPAKGTVSATFGQKGVAGKGVVISGELGEPVVAAANGTVVYAGSALVGYGRLLIVKHNAEWLSAYGHNQRLLVHEGQEVTAGEQIATMGVAPDGKSELYFEIRRDGKPVDPLHFLSSKR